MIDPKYLYSDIHYCDANVMMSSDAAGLDENRCHSNAICSEKVDNFENLTKTKTRAVRNRKFDPLLDSRKITFFIVSHVHDR